MIKRITFATRRTELRPEASADAPREVRPVRSTVCTTVPGLTVEAPKHDAVGTEWFTDAAHLARFEAWLASGAAPTSQVGPGPGPVIVADEVVARGADWLDRRWREGGERWKHIAIAERAAGLTPAEFVERWRDHAGTVGGSGAAPATVIPDEVRGLAYVQNHPRPRVEGEWAYAAVNEVWFDDLDALRARIDWFTGRPVADDGLFGRSWFLAACETVVADITH